MSFLRAFVIWIMALSLPIEGAAAMAMAHCKDMPSASAESPALMPAGHDHAAMMAMADMEGSDSVEHMHHAMPSSEDESGKGDSTAKPGCECGCQCSGNCAVSCAGTMLSFAQSGLSFAGIGDSVAVAMPQGQAHAAYRYEPLRPPSAVAL